ncbi:MAG TPA: prolipoprotein diacylglyceryl transferase [Candidatus Moranbacteria bacterium]|nr:prolipoprotein diacylglyceryl transferase [Candidatus Moranbacteria bacterium]HBI51144.1 prolipoprotein diacylglyceryl transferase [Candidatus Moranbacteria bacterium]HBU11127.1 prolipoprotein diacylglyceryl transferase [Candidatus Moranbacteria bacterium]HCO99191.1 prolipoprotein diacylglyceryl transferase [Candidatus Moranbacteria bacterium]
MLYVICYMLYDFYQHLPSFIDPVAFTIGSFSVRWYSISYIIGFLVVYLVLMWRIRLREVNNIYQISNFQFPISNKILNPKSENKNTNESARLKVNGQMLNVVIDFLMVVFFAGLLGGRLGYVLFYNPSFYFANPLSIISPYDLQGHYIGLFGMSYHGALLGAILAGYVFTYIKKIDFLSWADFIIVALPAGYFFGRVGNFLNGELYGRVTNSPLGMYFSVDLANLRHPSQLYEAFLEGILLFVVLWLLRNKKNKKGTLFGIYLMCYGFFRIIAEQFREPDSQLGLFWNFLTMGQLLSLGMIVFGLFFWFQKKESNGILMT